MAADQHRQQEEGLGQRRFQKFTHGKWQNTKIILYKSILRYRFQKELKRRISLVESDKRPRQDNINVFYHVSAALLGWDIMRPYWDESLLIQRRYGGSLSKASIWGFIPVYIYCTIHKKTKLKKDALVLCRAEPTCQADVTIWMKFQKNTINSHFEKLSFRAHKPTNMLYLFFSFWKSFDSWKFRFFYQYSFYKAFLHSAQPNEHVVFSGSKYRLPLPRAEARQSLDTAVVMATAASWVTKSGGMEECWRTGDVNK